MNNKIKISVVMSLLILSTQGIANEGKEKISLEEVSVNESSSYKRDDLVLSSPTNMYRIEKSAQFGTEVLTQEDIQAHRPKDIIDLLNKATGVDISYQGRKSPFQIKLRGGGQITYIIDGAILPSTSNRILQKIPMIAIEEIQIIRSSTALSLAPTIGLGASSSGSGNNIGFVIIRTKQPKKTEGIISAYLEKSESHPVANGQSLYIGTTFGNPDELHGYIGGMGSRYDRPSQDSWFDGSEANSGMFNGGLNYGGFALNLMGYKDEGTFEMQRVATEAGKPATDDKWHYDPLKTTILSLDSSMAWSESQITLFSLSSVEYKHNELIESFANNNIAPDKLYKEETQTYSLRHNARFDNTFIQIGGQYSHSKGFGANLMSAYNKFDTNVYGYSLSVEQTLLNGDLVLDAGFRRDQKHIKNSATKATNNNANNNINLAPANVFALGAVYNIDTMHRVNARYMKANEGGSDFDLRHKNNLEFHEESQVRYEIGIEGNYAKYLNIMGTYFDVKIENQKSATNDTYTDIQGNEYYFYTEGDSRRKGTEIIVNGVINKNTRYKLSWTRMLKNTNGSSESTGISTPRNMYNALLSHTWQDYQFNVSAKRVDPYAATNTPNAVIGDYTRVDANIEKDFNLNGYTATTKLYGRNLTNDYYSTSYRGGGYYFDRGRVVGLELTLAF